MARKKGDKRTPADFAVWNNIPTREAVVASAFAAYKRGDFPTKQATAEAFLARFYGEAVWAQGDEQRRDKAKYIVHLMSEIERQTIGQA